MFAIFEECNLTMSTDATHLCNTVSYFEFTDDFDDQVQFIVENIKTPLL